MTADFDFLSNTQGDADFQLEIFKSRTNGSPQEFKVYEELTRRGLQEDVDFRFKSDRMGGLSRLGDAKIHFIIGASKLALRVQGRLWETAPKSSHGADELQKLQWQGRGYFVIDFVQQEVDDNVARLVDLAFAGRETARARAVLSF